MSADRAKTAGTGPRLEGIAPIVPVRDIGVSLPFYTDTLGFEVRAYVPARSYALLGRGEAGIILVGGADEQALKATATQIAAYVWVDDVDALWARFAPRLEGLPEGRFRPPFVRDYGMREFHVRDPDGFLILFGQDVG